MLKLKNFRKVLAILMSLGAVGGFGLVPGVVPKPTVLAGPEDSRNTNVTFIVNGKNCSTLAVNPDVERLVESMVRNWTRYVGENTRLAMVSASVCKDKYIVRVNIEDNSGTEVDADKGRDILRQFIACKRAHNDIETLKKSKYSLEENTLDLSLMESREWKLTLENLMNELRDRKFTGIVVLHTDTDGEFGRDGEKIGAGGKFGDKKFLVYEWLSNTGVPCGTKKDGNVTLEFRGGVPQPRRDLSGLIDTNW